MYRAKGVGDSTYFDFYNTMYKEGLLSYEDVKKACDIGAITIEEFEYITQTDYETGEPLNGE